MTLQEPKTHKEHRIRALVDAHVHIHDCFDLQEFFDAAARNFVFNSSASASTTLYKYVLCLTETNEADKFGQLAKYADDYSASKGSADAVWNFRHSGNDECLIATHPVLGEIAVVAGRQIVTAEKLEILALGTVAKWQDGLPASDVIESVISCGAIAVLPWGFGKWLGRRGRAVENLIQKHGDGSLYLGDNSGRLGIVPDPSEFALAKKSGMRILPGSDPLPFATEYDRPGSFGFYTDNVANKEGVWRELRNMLQRGDGDLQGYGSLESPLRFVRNQVAMQYVTRISNRRKAS